MRQLPDARSPLKLSRGELENAIATTWFLDLAIFDGSRPFALKFPGSPLMANLPRDAAAGSR